MATCQTPSHLGEHRFESARPRTTCSIAIGTHRSVPTIDRTLEAFFGDADHRELAIIQPQRPVENGGVAVEALLPERVAEHDDRTLARNLILICPEETTERRPCAEHVEVIARHHACQ